MNDIIHYITETYHDLKSKKVKPWHVVPLIAPVVILIVRLITIFLFY